MHRYLLIVSLVIAGCTVRAGGPPPAAPPPSAPPPAGGPPPPPPPPVAQEHADYLQALSDLRTARRYLGHRPQGVVMKWDEHIAIQEVDNAIKMLRDASIGDERWEDTPPNDIPTWGGRLDRALELVVQAGKDVMYAEEHHDPLSTRIQKMILQHIGNAKRYIQAGIDEAKREHR